MKKILSLTILMAFILLVGLVAVAFAADPTPQQTVASTLQQTVFPVIGSFFLGLVSLIVTKIVQKFKIDALTQQNNFLIQIAAQGVAYAEEKAASIIGSKAQLTGSQKLDIAIAYICKSLPKVSQEEAERAAMAALAMIPGVGATGAAAVALNGQAAPSLGIGEALLQPVAAPASAAEESAAA